MAANDKDTLYIDIDDEITGIIDKVRGSKGKVVALVLPKRASVFQSLVNMKLLKRAADSDKKNVVLITTESGLLPLAGLAGLHVAKTLTSKPEIPLAPTAIDDAEEAIAEDGEEIEMPPDPKQTVGALADKTAPKATPTTSPDGLETLMLDADDVPPEADAGLNKPGPKSFEPPAKTGKKAKNKKLKVPNFERFRLVLVIVGLLLLLLIAGFIFANTALPKATIDVKTDATNVDSSFNLNLSTTASNVDPTSGTIPAKLVSQQKTYSASEVTTGQKNEGSKATGSVAMVAQYCNGNFPPAGGPPSVPDGTGLSANGLTYITQAETTFSNNSKFQGGCFNFQATQSTPIQAQTGGSSYNGATLFTVAGYSNVSAQVDQAVSGGTDNIVQSVNQNDINNAKAKISASNNATMQQVLQNQLQQDGYYAIGSTFQPGTPAVTSSANVGDVTNSVTVTETITYTMFGVHQSDLDSLITNNVDSQINTSKQSVLDDGLSKATFGVNSISSSGAQIAFSTVAVAGPNLDVNSLKQQVEGLKSGEVQTQLQANPDVTSVSVKLSPFWITTVPKNTSRITINIAKPTTTVNSNSNANSP